MVSLCTAQIPKAKVFNKPLEKEHCVDTVTNLKSLQVLSSNDKVILFYYYIHSSGKTTQLNRCYVSKALTCILVCRIRYFIFPEKNHFSSNTDLCC